MSDDQQQHGAPGPADDVEGHAAKFRGFTDEPAQDDTEGHVVRGRGLTDEPPPDDVDGHLASRKF